MFQFMSSHHSAIIGPTTFDEKIYVRIKYFWFLFFIAISYFYYLINNVFENFFDFSYWFLFFLMFCFVFVIFQTKEFLVFFI